MVGDARDARDARNVRNARDAIVQVLCGGEKAGWGYVGWIGGEKSGGKKNGKKVCGNFCWNFCWMSQRHAKPDDPTFTNCVWLGSPPESTFRVHTYHVLCTLKQ